MITVYYADISALDDDDVYYKFYNAASEHRRAKADRYKFRRDKNLCIGASTIIDFYLKQHGLTEKDTEYGLNQNGKPFFKSLPLIHFSLSHSGTVAAAAFGDSELGIDIEKIKTGGEKTAKRFFCPGEYEFIINQKNEDAKEAAFTRLWVLKESFVKMLGTGLTLPLKEFEILPQGKKTAVKLNGEPFPCFFAEPAVFNGYKAAVCSKSANDEITAENITNIFNGFIISK